MDLKDLHHLDTQHEEQNHFLCNRRFHRHLSFSLGHCRTVMEQDGGDRDGLGDADGKQL